MDVHQIYSKQITEASLKGERPKKFEIVDFSVDILKAFGIVDNKDDSMDMNETANDFMLVPVGHHPFALYCESCGNQGHSHD